MLDQIDTSFTINNYEVERLIEVAILTRLSPNLARIFIL